jgi:hypothetical protein
VYCHIRYFNDYSWIAPADKMRYEWMQHPNYYVTYTHTVRVLKTKQHPNYYLRIVVPHVCMCVCVCACVCLYTYIYVCIYIYIYIYTYRYEYTFVHAMGTEAIYEPVHLGVAWTSPVYLNPKPGFLSIYLSTYIYTNTHNTHTGKGNFSEKKKCFSYFCALK